MPKTFYILCPAGAETGGVEDLHQLYGALQSAGQAVYMAYVCQSEAFNDAPQWHPTPYLSGNRIPARYAPYGNPYLLAMEIPDTPETVVIAPEIYQRGVLSLKKALPVVWFLAAGELVPKWNGKNVFPVAQSLFAAQTLINQGWSSLMLPDCLTPEVTRVETFLNEGRDPAVLFYGGRGREASIELLQGIESKEVIGLPCEEMCRLFRWHKHFVYPARQPGMDKTPREAAVNGCVVWILTEGAGAYFEDTPLPERFRCATPEIMRERLLTSLSNHYQYLADYEAQEEYRAWIRTAPERFAAGVQRLIEAVG